MSNVASLLTRTSTRFLLAVLGGSLAYVAFPTLGIWIAIFPLVGLIYLSGREASGFKTLGIGFVAGFTFFAAQTSWLSLYLGPAPLIALSTLQAIIFAMFFAAQSRVARNLSHRTTGTLRSALLAASFAAFWVARAWFSGNYPYGGFPWGRLVTAEADTVIAKWVWLGGMPLADFLIVFATVFAIEQVRLNRKLASGLTVLGAVVVLAVLPAALPISGTAETGTMRIAAVQGNANAGLFANRDSGKILQNHIVATEQLIASGKRFDLVVWPENAVDLDVFGNPNNYRLIADFVDRLGKPLVFGTVTHRDKLYNTSVLWLPNQGKVDWYDKTKPVPFAEYVPDREVWSKVAPDLIGLLPYDFAAGNKPGLYDVAGHRIGTLICFEIAVDDIPRDLSLSGAEAILSQTNNSDFGHSDEAYQQLAIARIKAIESGRSLVNVSTVGPSAIYLADGSSVGFLEAFTRGYLVADVPLRISATPASFVAKPFELGCTAIAVFGLVWNFVRRRGRGAA